MTHPDLFIILWFLSSFIRYTVTKAVIKMKRMVSYARENLTGPLLFVSLPFYSSRTDEHVLALPLFESFFQRTPIPFFLKAFTKPVLVTKMKKNKNKHISWRVVYTENLHWNYFKYSPLNDYCFKEWYQWITLILLNVIGIYVNTKKHMSLSKENLGTKLMSWNKTNF